MLALGGSIVAFAIVLLLLALQADPTVVERPLARGLGWLTGRDVEIGQLDQLQISRDLQFALVARGVRVGNPDWAGESDFLRAERLALSLDLRWLWSKEPVQIQEVELSGLSLTLLAPADTSPNWRFWWSDDESDLPEQIELPLIVHHTRIENAELVYRGPDQQIQARLERLSVQDPGGNELIEMDAVGVVNDLPLRMRGHLGPAGALISGRGLRADLRADWGKLTAQVAGEIQDLSSLQGPDLRLLVTSPVSRPLLDALGMQELRDGPLRVDVRLTEDAPGIRLRASGSVGGLIGQVDGKLLDPLQLDGIEFDLDVRGPSLAESGAAFERPGLPAVPYQLSATLLKNGSKLEVRNGRLTAGTGELSFFGELPRLPTIDDWQAQISGRDVELSLFAAPVGLQLPDRGKWDVAVRLGATRRGRERVHLELENPTDRLSLSGVVGDGRGYRGTDLSLVVEGENLSEMAKRLGASNFPVVPYRIAGEIVARADGWELADVSASTPLLNLEVHGTLPLPLRRRELDVRVTAGTADLPAALKAFGLDAEPALPRPLTLDARVRGPSNSLRVSEANLTSGSARARFHGSLGDPKNLQGLDVEWSLRTPDLSEVVSHARFPTSLPLDARGRLIRGPEGWRLRGVEGATAGARFELGALVTDQPGYGGSNLKLEASGDNLRGLLAGWRDDPRLAEPFALGIDLDYEVGRLDVRKVEASLGALRLSGNLVIDEPPDLSASRGSLNVTAPSSRQLLALLGLDLDVADGPLSLDAELTGLTDRVRLEQFEATIADSDLSGSGELLWGVKPRIEVMLHSRRLNLPFLLPRIDSAPLETSGELEAPESAAAEQSARVIPDTALDVDWLTHFDGRLAFHVDNLTVREALSSSVVLDLLLVDGTLASREFSWNGAFSSGYAQVVISNEEGHAAVDLYLNSQRIPLLWLLAGNPDAGADWTYMGRLWGKGSTLRSLAASLNGGLIYKGGGGRLNNRGLDMVLGDVVGEIFSYVNPWATKEPTTRIVCSAGAMSVTDGVIDAKPGLVVRLDKVDMASAGSIDLRNERVDLTFKSKSRKGLGISVGKALTPFFRIGGTLANPRLSLDAKSGAVSAGAAVATAGLSIIAGGLWDRWIATAADPCDRLFSRAAEGTKAEFRALLTPPNVLATLEARAEREENR
ncbi:MAG: hypothetical protein R3E86_14650 [Pseudomonadales bacterium]